MDKNGNLNKKKGIHARWTEHFEKELNRDEPENPVLSDQVYECVFDDTIEEISVSEPTNKQAMKGLKNQKAPGTDSIAAELLT